MPRQKIALTKSYYVNMSRAEMYRMYLIIPIETFSIPRHGLSVEAACTSVSKDLLDIFNFALVWGRSSKFNPQRVGLSHVLMDEDVFQVVPKTLVQQKQSKDYRQKVISTRFPTSNI
jgi:TGS domain